MRDELTHERLKELLNFDSNTGVFTWRVNRQRTQAGDIAGTRGTRGYTVIRVDQAFYKAHRLAWFYVYGVWPRKNIDHINGITGDNRISNLREACQAVNNHNRRSANSNNVSGYLGVSVTRSGKFLARIRFNGRYRCLGTYDDPQKAHEAYLAAKREHHEGNTL